MSTFVLMPNLERLPCGMPLEYALLCVHRRPRTRGNIHVDSLLLSCVFVLAGSIPPELGALSELVELNLAHNNLTGSFFADMYGLFSIHSPPIAWATRLLEPGGVLQNRKTIKNDREPP